MDWIGALLRLYPREYRELMLMLEVGQKIPRRDILQALVRVQYVRNDLEFVRGTFRVRGDTVELYDDHGTVLREIATDGSVTGLRRALDELDRQGADGTVTLRRPTLDDVFLAVTTAESRSDLVKEIA